MCVCTHSLGDYFTYFITHAQTPPNPKGAPMSMLLVSKSLVLYLYITYKYCILPGWCFLCFWWMSSVSLWQLIAFMLLPGYENVNVSFQIFYYYEVRD